MSTTQTPHLGLIKPTPGTGEYADVSVINGNMDKLDAAIGDIDVSTDGSLQSQIDGIQESVASLQHLASQGGWFVLEAINGWGGIVRVPLAKSPSSISISYARAFDKNGNWTNMTLDSRQYHFNTLILVFTVADFYSHFNPDGVYLFDVGFSVQ